MARLPARPFQDEQRILPSASALNQNRTFTMRWRRRLLTPTRSLKWPCVVFIQQQRDTVAEAGSPAHDEAGNYVEVVVK
jgi:hypothetical protein